MKERKLTVRGQKRKLALWYTNSLPLVLASDSGVSPQSLSHTDYIGIKERLCRKIDAIVAAKSCIKVPIVVRPRDS